MGSSRKIVGDKNWVVELDQLYATPGNHPPGGADAGWKTFEEIRAEINKGIVTTRKILAAARASGRLEAYSGSAASPATGQLTRQVWYRYHNKEGDAV